MGFGSEVGQMSDEDKMKLLNQVTPDDLVKFGLIPELIGRLPIITHLNGLDKFDLVRVLSEPKNALLKQYKKLFSLDKIELEFKQEALEEVAEQALKRETGARGLRAIMEEILTDFMYELPDDPTVEKLIIDKDTVKGEGTPEVIHNKNKKPVEITISSKVNKENKAF